MPRAFKIYITGLVLLIPIVFATLYIWGADTAFWINYLLYGVYMIGALLYVVFWDSRKRWPGVSWSVRLSRVMTFYRDSNYQGRRRS